VVSLSGINSAPVAVSILAATPAIFTTASSGKGPAVALNQDGTVNGPANPASAGSVLQLFATGLGPVGPAVPTGQLAPAIPPLALSVTNPTVTIGGVSANVVFSGLAPTLVGLWQVNVQIPANAGTGTSRAPVAGGGPERESCSDLSQIESEMPESPLGTDFRTAKYKQKQELRETVGLFGIFHSLRLLSGRDSPMPG